MARDNRTRVAPRIRGELKLLGHLIAASTVAIYMTMQSRKAPSETWSTFTAKYMNATSACDFFVELTIPFTILPAIMVLALDRDESCKST